MSEYTEAAPNLSKLVDQAAFEKDFPEPVPPKPPVTTTTGAKKAALYAYVKAIYATGSRKVPLIRTAVAVGVPVLWVRIIVREIEAAIAAVYSEDVE